MNLLRRDLSATGEELGDSASKATWRTLRDVVPLLRAPEDAIWRISVPPASGAAAIRAIDGASHYYFDWAGGLIWLGVPAEGDAGATRVRRAVARTGGHATLMRAPVSVRAVVDVFQPQEPALARLTKRVKQSFDPMGRLNPGRMYQGL